MENEDSCTSLPYIDDSPTDDETNPSQYNLKIIENCYNQNRNIEIINRFPNETIKSLNSNSLAPLADETEFNDNKLNGLSDEDTCKHLRKESEMKLIIKGWNSSISIQGLDNKSFITFKRRCGNIHKKVERNEEKKSKPVIDETKFVEKTRKGRWKTLTRSIMLTKTARFERRGMDERYPKYVLLKNEEDEITKEKENYPKMFIFNEKSSKQKKNGETKTEFSFKKSFKNKTEPIVPLDKILAGNESIKEEESRMLKREGMKQKKSLTQRNVCKKKITSERRKSMGNEEKVVQSSRNEPLSSCPFSHGQVCSEIQGIFEDTLKLLPQVQSEENQQHSQKPMEYFSSIPPQFCQFPCHDPYCCVPPQGQPPEYTPVYAPHKLHVYKTLKLQNKPCRSEETTGEEQTHSDVEVDLENLPFGMLSTFFPRVVIMNTVRNNGMRGEEEIVNTQNMTVFEDYQPSKTDEEKDKVEETESKIIECLEVPKQDLTLKTRMVQEAVKPEMEIKELFLGEVGLKEFSTLSEDIKTKSQGSDATEYLQYSELDSPENESVERINPPIPPQINSKEEKRDKIFPSVDKFKIEDGHENSENLSLTKIGYKMYDNLTKLSLNREKEMTKKPEVNGCGCNGNGTQKSPYNITLESNNRVVKVTVPENELNFQIVNSQGGDIQIGVMSGGQGKEEIKKIVRKDELWHCDDGGKEMVLLNKKSHVESSGKGIQNFKVSLANNREIFLSIEMNDTETRKDQVKEKSTKEMKVGTDDFDLAGGDFVCSFGENYKNLSPRVGELLKHLHKKLETDQKERKFLDEKINQKLIDQKFQGGGILPGLFLVKHISPRTPSTKKSPEVSSFRKEKKTTESHERRGQLREYYCEECLATMRIFEDENPSVKSMVDKFETIIQLESY